MHQQNSFDYSQDNFSFFRWKNSIISHKLRSFVSLHDLELNTAIKPYVINFSSTEKVAYFDPDIKFYSDLSVMTDLLDENQVR